MLHAAPVLAQTTHPRGSVVYLRGVEYITQTTPKSSNFTGQRQKNKTVWGSVYSHPSFGRVGGTASLLTKTEAKQSQCSFFAGYSKKTRKKNIGFGTLFRRKRKKEKSKTAANAYTSFYPNEQKQ